MFLNTSAQLKARNAAYNAAHAITAPVCADDDCMQCAFGLHCPNAPRATAKPRVRVCLNWTASQLDLVCRAALDQANPRAQVSYSDAELAQSFARAEYLRANGAAILESMRSHTTTPVHVNKPAGTSKSALARIARAKRNHAAMVRS
jgi:hypothetical protein